VSSPHVAKVSIATSDPNGVHRFGEPLSITFWIRHSVSMASGAFCFQIVNQFQTPVIHSSFYQTKTFGHAPGVSVIECHFPMLRLNVGQFDIRTCLLESTGHIYEILDGICAFEVIRIDRSQLFGWRPEICTYQEEDAWKTVDVKSQLEM
jgi:hypothetical protein